jgi:hypothetical protein
MFFFKIFLFGKSAAITIIVLAGLAAAVSKAE